MASGSKGITPEEEAAMQAANNAKAGEMAAQQQDNSYMVTELHGGTGKSGDMQGSSIDMKTDKKGRQYFTSNDSGDPSSIFYYNDHTGQWSSHGGSSYSLGQAPKQAPTESGGGGGGGGGKPPPERTKPTVPGAHGPADSETILGDTYDHMMEWEPISSDGEGGTQEMNPLVDPNNWLHQVDPKYATPTYSNAPPNIQYGPGGLLSMDYDQENKGLLA